MDFFKISVKEGRGEKKGTFEVMPDFVVGRSEDFMVRGQSFYAIWDEERQTWSTDEYEVVRLVDEAVALQIKKLASDGMVCDQKRMSLYSSNVQNQFRKFMKNIGDNSKQLDEKLTFANSVVKKSDHVSQRLPYSLVRGDCKAWDELLSVLYEPVEREKIEWGIGAVIEGDSKEIEKFFVLYGGPGTGKGTILKIIELLFQGYTTTFEASSLVGSNNNFATEPFKNNPLVGIQHDGSLAKIEDNTKLNSIVGHDPMLLNEKFKPTYTTKLNTFLFMGTNDPVHITNAKSGIIRRLIDVNPTGVVFEEKNYRRLIAQVKFELGAIAHHCLDVYRKLGKDYYSDYSPTRMMFQTNVFFNFVEANFDLFKYQNGVSLNQAWKLYKTYCEDALVPYKLQMHKFREELKNYFKTFNDRETVDGIPMRSYYSGFITGKFETPVKEIIEEDVRIFSISLNETESLFDKEYSSYPAQYGKSDETPSKYWTDEERMIDGEMKKPKPSQVVDTVLSDLDTSKLHFVKVPENHIVIDFDLKDDDGAKSSERNLEAASAWPPTYTEFSKSGGGVHLHYLYTGADLDRLAAGYSDGIEVKVYRGGSSLRRQLTKCNDIPVATIDSGLPLKEKKMKDTRTIQSEKGIRDMIVRNLNKEFHPGTKPSVDFIAKILDEAYQSGKPYDVSDMKSQIAAFANNSQNQAQTCLRIVQKMKWKAEPSEEEQPSEPTDDRITFFDCEVFPNLFVVCWKRRGVDGLIKMINPTAQEIEMLFRMRLVGFYNREYDNHILWARFMGANNQQLYNLSKRLTSKDHNAKFGDAYRVSYADVHDFASNKMGLKKWEIELGIFHKELNLPWDEPVDVKDWPEVVDYCGNDVVALEEVFEHLIADFNARQIVAELSGLTVNDTNKSHAERIIFGKERRPQSKFNYSDLSEQFPGYVFDPFAKGDKSTYRDEVVGEGGYVYAEPGMYENVTVLDVASMHPSSIKALNLFGPYTEKYVALMDARMVIKKIMFALDKGMHEAADVCLEQARGMLEGSLKSYLETSEEETEAEFIKRLFDLSNAQKLVLNSIYGFTASKFESGFRDPRNVDNIVAKRGALFMIDLKHQVQDLGFQVVHIKTDSIKIPNPTPKIIQFIMEYGKQWGYEFEVENVYEKFCLVNDAVYIAKIGETVKKDKTVPAHWDAVGTQFQVPYVFKTLFSKEPIEFNDKCVTKSVQKGHLSLLYSDNEVDGGVFVGKVGRFVPLKGSYPGLPYGAVLSCIRDGKATAVSGTKGYFWGEADSMENLIEMGIVAGTNLHEDAIDLSYFERQVEEAVSTIEKFGDFERFVS